MFSCAYQEEKMSATRLIALHVASLFEHPAGVFHYLIMLLLRVFHIMLRCRFDGLVVQRGCNQLDVSGLLIQLRPVSRTQLVRRDPVSVCDPGTLSVILDEQLDRADGHPLMAD